MKKSTASLLLLLLTAFGIAAQDTGGGTDAAITVTMGGAVTLQAAITQAKQGDIVEIHEGVYTYDRSLVIDGKDDLTIRAKGQVWLICTDHYSDVIIVSNSTGIELDDLKARHAQGNDELGCSAPVVHIVNSKYVGVYRCELSGSGAIGVSVESSEGIKVSECYIHDNNFSAFYFQDAGDITLSHSTIVHNSSTISGTNIKALDMVGNIIADNEMSPTQ